jgi:hypothetical protein
MEKSRRGVFAKRIVAAPAVRAGVDVQMPTWRENIYIYA